MICVSWKTIEIHLKILLISDHELQMIQEHIADWDNNQGQDHIPWETNMKPMQQQVRSQGQQVVTNSERKPKGSTTPKNKGTHPHRTSGSNTKPSKTQIKTNKKNNKNAGKRGNQNFCQAE